MMRDTATTTVMPGRTSPTRMSPPAPSRRGRDARVARIRRSDPYAPRSVHDPSQPADASTARPKDDPEARYAVLAGMVGAMQGTADPSGPVTCKVIQDVVWMTHVLLGTGDLAKIADLSLKAARLNASQRKWLKDFARSRWPDSMGL